MPADPPTRRHRRTWPQRLFIGVNVVLISVCVVAASGVGYFYWRFGQLPRVGIDSLSEEGGPSDPFNVLVVGSDSRENLTGDEAVLLGQDQVGGQRADTMMIVRVDPRATRGAILSIPRDLWVTIQPGGGKDRINAAYEQGPEGLVQTIQSSLGVPIHHFVQVDFVGFRSLVAAIGGVELYFPGPARDTMAGLHIEEGGCVNLTGDQALAYVRARQYRYYEAGRWRSDPTGDLGRIERQQDFIRRVIRKALARGLYNPAKANELLDVAIDHVTVNDGLDLQDMIKLAQRFKSLDPTSVDMYTLPTRAGSAGRASVLFLQEEEARPILDRFRGIPEDAVLPSEVRVRVLNGTGESGQAGDVAAALGELGFSIATPGDAASFGVTRTVVRHRPDAEAAGLLVARHLVVGAQVVAAPDQEIDVVVVTGADFAGVRDEPIPADRLPTTTTTAAPTTTTAPPTTGAPDGGAEPQAPPGPPC